MLWTSYMLCIIIYVVIVCVILLFILVYHYQMNSIHRENIVAQRNLSIKLSFCWNGISWGVARFSKIWTNQPIWAVKIIRTSSASSTTATFATDSSNFFHSKNSSYDVSTSKYTSMTRWHRTVIYLHILFAACVLSGEHTYRHEFRMNK